MMKFLLIYLILPIFLFSKPEVQKIYAIAEAPNGHLIAVGTSHSTKIKKGYLLIINRATGNKIAEKQFGGKKEAVFKAVTSTLDGGFLLVGYAISKGANNRDAWMVKVDEKGKELWQHNFGTNGLDELQGVLAMEDGSMVVYGIKNGQKEGDLWLVNLLKDEIIWEQQIGKKEIASAVSILSTGQNRLALVGNTPKRDKVWCLRTDERGKLVGNIQFYGEKRDFVEVQGFAETLEGGLILTGLKRTQGIGDLDAWVLKTNVNGTADWNKCYGGSKNDIALSILPDYRGNYQLLIATKSLKSNNSSASLQATLLDKNGQTISNQTLAIPFKPDLEQFPAIRLFDENIAVINHLKEDAETIFITNFNQSTASKGGIEIELICSDIRFEDRVEGNGNGILEPNERGNISFKLFNNSPYHLPDVKIVIQPLKELYGVNCTQWQETHTRMLRALRKNRFSIPIIAGKDLSAGQAAFEIVLYVKGKKQASFQKTIECQRQNSFATKGTAIRWIEPDLYKSDTIFVSFNEENVLIKADILHANALLKNQIRPYINGISISDSKLDLGEFDVRAINNSFEHRLETKLPKTLFKEGVNEVLLEFTNQEGDTIRSAPIVLNVSNQKGNLHVLSIGAQYEDLLFTAKDANDFADAFINQKGDKTLFNEVFITKLVTEKNTTKDQILQAFYQLKSNYHRQKITKSDVLMVFISTHGKINAEDGRFKILPSNYDNLPFREIDYEYEVLRWLNAVPCKKIVFVDACHSGGISKDSKDWSDTQLSLALQRLHNQQEGLTTLSSCLASELSYEDKEWNNGAFTKAIREAFSTTSLKEAASETALIDKDQNQILTLGELYEYLQNRVPALVHQKNGQSQTPFMESKLKRDIPIYILKKQ